MATISFRMWRRFGTLPSEIYRLREQELWILLAFFSYEDELRRNR